MLDISTFFDASYYSVLNPDLRAAGLVTDSQLFDHFQRFGLDENRSFSPLVDLDFYLESYPDLDAAGVRSDRQLIQHLASFGVAERRRFSAVTDIDYYLQQNPDLVQAFGNNGEQAFQHLVRQGVDEGRAFSPVVNLSTYLAANPDVNQALGGDRSDSLEHLVAFGVAERRLGVLPGVDSENRQLQVVQRFYGTLAAVGAGQATLADAFRFLTDDVTWTFPGRPNVLPWAGRREGLAATTDAIIGFLSNIRFLRFEPVQFSVEGDTVTVLIKEDSVALGTGLTYSIDVINRFTVRGDRITSNLVISDSFPIEVAYTGRDPLTGLQVGS